ncbi:MAG: ABC transporter permease [bacterium]
MRPLLGLIRKEFIQVFRDHNMLRLIFAMPVMQLLIFGYVVNTEVNKIDLDVYDFDRSDLSREFIQAVGAGEYFIPDGKIRPLQSLDRRFQRGRAEVALVIDESFSERLQQKRPVTVGLIADGTNANATALGMSYLAQIAQQFSRRQLGMELPLRLHNRLYYNPESKSVYFMIPGIVASLLTMITVMLTSMAIVRERERGTLEQVLVTPIGTATLLAGKIIPFAILGLVEIGLALGFGVLWFGVPFVGSVGLLLGLALLYLLSTLGLGLLFSTVTSTQQQAMFFAWFFSIFAMLTSGFFTPIANMPSWMQAVTLINPMRYFVEIARGIMLKGAGLGDLWSEVYPLVVFGTVIFSLAVFRFTKRAA